MNINRANSTEGAFQWIVDELLYFRGKLYISGWAFHTKYRISEMGYLISESKSEKEIYYEISNYGLESLDVQEHYGDIAINCRFAFHVGIDSPIKSEYVKLVFILENGDSITIENIAKNKLKTDVYHILVSQFFKAISEKTNGIVLEIGSRNRSGVTRRNIIPEHIHYIGMDIINGENVDVIGDTHNLTSSFSSDTFDAVFSMSVFEHLIMPWKVVLEINHVMKTGGIVMITTHQTFPMHDVPWDFWRFSDQAWYGLFNKYTGFEIIDTALGEPASIVAHTTHPVTINLDAQPAYLGSAVLARKISNTQLSWDVETKEIINTVYPSSSVAAHK
jgi:hypothetical protein